MPVFITIALKKSDTGQFFTTIALKKIDTGFFVTTAL
jgi:hypothetical protein